MASGLYAKALQAFLDGDIDWSVDTIVAYLVDNADYTVNLATHDFLDDVPAGARVAGPVTLTGKSSTDGVANSAAWTFTAVTGDPSESIILVKSTGVEATSRLIAYYDTASGLPVTPNGGNITVTPDAGANKLFKL